MISQYDKLYIAFEKYKKTGEDIPEKINDILENNPEIPDDYDYVDVE